MKKLGLVLAAALCLLAGILFFAYQQRGKESVQDDLAAFIPANALMVSTFIHLDQVAANFASTPLGHLFAKDTMHGILRDAAQSDPELLSSYDEFHDSVAGFFTHPVFRAVFGDDLTLVVLPPDPALLEQNPEVAVQRSLAVYATTMVAPLTELAGLLTETTQGQNVSVTREKVEDVDLSHIRIAKNGQAFDLYAWTSGKVLMLAADSAPILAGVRAQQSGNSLGSLAGYQEASAFWRKTPSAAARQASFYNLQVLHSLLLKLDEESARWWDGLDYGYDMTATTESGLENNSRLRFRYEALHPLLQGTVDESLNSGTALAPVSLNTLFFAWNLFGKPETLLKFWAAEDADAYALAQDWTRQNLAMSLEEAATALGPRCGLVLNGLDANPLLPLPDLTVLAGVRNQENAGKLVNALNRALAENDITGTQQQIEAGQLWVWPVPVQLGLKVFPALGLNADLLALGSKQESVQSLLAVSAKDRQSLPEDLAARLGPDMASRFTSANNSALLCQPAQIAVRTQPLVSLLTPFVGGNGALVREIITLMQSTELVAAAASVSRDSFEGKAVWVRNAAALPAQ